jgi:MYXO-CTERM domain-containing protein
MTQGALHQSLLLYMHGTEHALSAGAKTGTSTATITGAAAGGVVAALLTFGLLLFWFRRRRRQQPPPPVSTDPDPSVHPMDDSLVKQYATQLVLLGQHASPVAAESGPSSSHPTTPLHARPMSNTTHRTSVQPPPYSENPVPLNGTLR